MKRYADDARKAGRGGGLFDAPGPREVLRAIDPETFGDLPEDLGQARGFARPGQEAPPQAVADPAGEDFDRGAQSPGAEAADAEIVGALREASAAPVIPARLVFTFDEARKAVSDLPSRDFRNSSAGGEIVATLSNNNLAKILNDKAVGKTGTPRAQALAVANIDSLFPRAIYGWSKPDRDGEPSIVALHRYFAPMTMPSGHTVLVKMTVKETRSPKTPNPLYTLEAVDVGTEAAVLDWLRTTRAADAGAQHAPPGALPSSTDAGRAGTGSLEGAPEGQAPAAARVAEESGDAAGETIRSADAVENMAQLADDFNGREDAATLAAARADLGAFAEMEIELPDGTRARAGDVLDDLDADQAADEAISSCLLDPAGAFTR